MAKEKTLRDGLGRLKFACFIPPNVRRQVSAALSDPSIEIVHLPFCRLKHLCKFQKDGYYKQKRQFRKLPTDTKKQRIRTIFHQFQNTHARYVGLITVPREPSVHSPVLSDTPKSQHPQK